MKQPKALLLAEVFPYLEGGERSQWIMDAAAELRRLHEVNQEWERKAATWLASPEAAQRLDGYRELAQRINYLETMNQELLEALEEIANIPDLEWGTDWEEIEQARGIARAAIAKATGEQS